PLRRRERMVQRAEVALVVALEHWELDDPERREAVTDEPPGLRDRVAQHAQRVVHDLRLVRTEENEVARLGADPCEDSFDGLVRQELQDRRLQAVAARRAVVDLDVRETLRAVARDEGRVLVDLLAG